MRAFYDSSWPPTPPDTYSFKISLVCTFYTSMSHLCENCYNTLPLGPVLVSEACSGNKYFKLSYLFLRPPSQNGLWFPLFCLQMTSGIGKGNMVCTYSICYLFQLQPVQSMLFPSFKAFFSSSTKLDKTSNMPDCKGWGLGSANIVRETC